MLSTRGLVVKYLMLIPGCVEVAASLRVERAGGPFGPAVSTVVRLWRRHRKLEAQQHGRPDSLDELELSRMLRVPLAAYMPDDKHAT